MTNGEIPYAFIGAWLIVIIVTSGVANFVYGSELDVIDYTPPDEPSVLDIGLNFIVIFANGVLSVIRVMTFTLPHMPVLFNIIFGSVFMVINFIWFLAIYPFLAKIVELILKGIDIITPDWL